MAIDKFTVVNEINFNIFAHMVHIAVFFKSVLIYHNCYIMFFYKLIRKECDNSLSSAKIKYLGTPNTYFHFSLLL